MSLWTHDFGEGLVEVDPIQQIYEADPTLAPTRADRYFREKIGALTALGLVNTRARGHRDHGYVLLVDPHLAVQRLRSSLKEKEWWDRWWAAYEARCREVGIDLELYVKKAAEPKVARPLPRKAGVALPALRPVIAPRAKRGIELINQPPPEAGTEVSEDTAVEPETEAGTTSDQVKTEERGGVP